MRQRRGQDSELVLLPLGGTGEIGMNCYLYGVGPPDDREWLMVDLGVKFGEEHEPGIDIVLPDVSYVSDHKEKLAGIVLTHAHEDHMGAVARLWPQLRVPVYCTPFAAALLLNKLAEAGIADEVPLVIKPMEARFTVGPFDLEYVAVTHSIPESMALAIRTPMGKILHTGDWKIDRTPLMPPDLNEKRLREIGDEGIDALVCDSTNALRDGFSPSESEIAATIEKIVAAAPRRVAVTTFASHVGRLNSAVKAARRAGREVVVVGRAMRNTIEAARACGYLQEAGTFLEEEAFGYLPPDKAMLLCTGSQGEPRAAIARIAEDTHPHVSLEDGDIVVFSSRTIPGNEKAVVAVQNNLARLGVELITPDDALVHTSGHPRKQELKAMYEWIRPRALVPMHGEPQHLREQVRLGKASGIPETVLCENGHVVRLAPGPAAIIDEAPSGRLHVDGDLIVPAEEGPAAHRRKLAIVGLVAVSLVLDGKHQLAGNPQIMVDGVPEQDQDGEPLIEAFLEATEQAFEALPRSRRKDDDTVIEAVRIGVRRAAKQLWGKKPVCKVMVHRL
jgi:ribonuclease J